MIRFLLLIVLGFIFLEAFSYVVHRWLFHGFLWPLHKTHHLPRKGAFEANDLFSFLFGSVSVLLLVFSDKSLESLALPFGLGIALYGAVYFVVHDLFTHRRFIPFVSSNRFFSAIRAAHQRHHQSVQKDGREPYGLFAVDYWQFGIRKDVEGKDSVSNSVPR